MALLDWIVIGVFVCALIGIVIWVISQKNAAQRMVLQEGENSLKMRLDLGKDAQAWSEFHPVLYTLKAQLDGIGSEEVTFGLRNFGTKGTQFTITVWDSSSGKTSV